MELQYSIEDGYDTDEPRRGTEHSAGLDIYIPRLTPRFIEDLRDKNKSQARISSLDTDPTIKQQSNDLYIPEHGRIIIPTGLRFNIPSGTYLEVANRGSTAALQGLIFGAHVIDEDYRGIVFINLINTTSYAVHLKPGTKLVQLIHKEYIKSTLKRVPPDALYEGLPPSGRGDGALGHTGQ